MPIIIPRAKYMQLSCPVIVLVALWSAMTRAPSKAFESRLKARLYGGLSTLNQFTNRPDPRKVSRFLKSRETAIKMHMPNRLYDI